MTEADILAATYWHLADIRRPSAIQQGSLDDFALTVVAEKVPCALSFSSMGPVALETSQPIRYETTLFVRPEVDIHAGDVVTVTDKVEKRETVYLAGEAAVYPSHRAVPLQREVHADGRYQSAGAI